MLRVILRIGAGAKALAALSLREPKRDVAYWHKADLLFAVRNVRFRGKVDIGAAGWRVRIDDETHVTTRTGNTTTGTTTTRTTTE